MKPNPPIPTEAQVRRCREMTSTITATIPIVPVAKGRPRATPVYEARLAAAVRQQLGSVQLKGPIDMTLLFIMPRPKRLMRKKDRDGLVWMDKRPDLDNLVKSTMDALAPFWGDDAQVCSLTAEKSYAEKTGQPRVVVAIQEME